MAPIILSSSQVLTPAHYYHNGVPLNSVSPVMKFGFCVPLAQQIKAATPPLYAQTQWNLTSRYKHSQRFSANTQWQSLNERTPELCRISFCYIGRSSPRDPRLVEVVHEILAALQEIHHPAVVYLQQDQRPLTAILMLSRTLSRNSISTATRRALNTFKIILHVRGP